MKSISGFFRYRFKLYYSSLRCWLSGGKFIYPVIGKVNFVCNQKDDFSKVIYISNGHEKYEMEWCAEFLNHLPTNSLVVDCGANIGYFSCYLSQTNPNHSYTAIEGNPKTYELLKSHIELLSLHNIKTIHSILAESTDKHYQISDKPGREPWQQAAEMANSDTPSMTLDQMVISDGIPAFIKIDCEGFEVKILKGAKSILSAGKTVFFIECNDEALLKAGNNRKELFTLLSDYKYRLLHLSSFDGTSEPGVEIKFDFPSREFNFVALPQDENLLKYAQSVFNKLV